MRRSQRFHEEAFDRFPVAPRAQEKFQAVSLRILGTREVHPRFFHFYRGLIHAPRVVRGREMDSAAPLQLGCIALHLAVG